MRAKRAQRTSISKKIFVAYTSKKFRFWQNRPYVSTYVLPFMLADVKWHTKQLGVQGILFVFNLALDIHGQYTTVKKGHPLTSVTRLYCGLRYMIHWGDLFFKVIPWPGLVYNCSRAQVHFLKVKFSLLIAYGKSWINWRRHFWKHPSRGSLLALAKSIYYITRLAPSWAQGWRLTNSSVFVTSNPSSYVLFSLENPPFLGLGR